MPNAEANRAPVYATTYKLRTNYGFSSFSLVGGGGAIGRSPTDASSTEPSTEPSIEPTDPRSRSEDGSEDELRSNEPRKKMEPRAAESPGRSVAAATTSAGAGSSAIALRLPHP